MLRGAPVDGQDSRARRCDMEAQVSKVSPKPLSVTPVGPVHPSSDSDEVNHSWADRVATVATPSTMARHAGSRATSSDATNGTMPRETASTATSKSRPATSVSVPVPSRRTPVRLGPLPRVAGELVGEWPVGPAREAAHPHQRLVPAPPRRQLGLPGQLDRLRSTCSATTRGGPVAGRSGTRLPDGRALRTWARRWPRPSRPASARRSTP